MIFLFQTVDVAANVDDEFKKNYEPGYLRWSLTNDINGGAALDRSHSFLSFVFSRV